MREPIEEYFLKIVKLAATRSTCPRRQVAAIITDDRNIVIGMGFNGVPRGYPHCDETPCMGRNDVSGNTSRCVAIHAEQNALLNCHDLDRAKKMFCTTFPCFSCMKLIANTKIREMYYLEDYPDIESHHLATDIKIKHYLVGL